MEVKPGYKQTEAGVIPEEWEAKSLRSVLSTGRLGGNYANQDAEAELPLMKMGNLARGYFDLSKVQFITPGVMPELAHRLVYGDVLFNTRNTLDLVGKVAIWRDELPVAYYNSNLMRLEFDPEEVCSNEYANYSLNTEGAVSRLRALATGTTSVAAIYTRDLMKLQVLVPPKPEQRAIAEALSDVDGLLGGLDRLIAKKRDLKQAAMQQLLTGQTRLPGFHGEWEELCLGDLFTFKNGLNKGKEFFGFGTPIVNYMDVFGSAGILCSKLEGRVSLTKQEIKNFDVKKGDVLFTRTSETPNEIGMASVILDDPDQTVFSGFVLRGRPKGERLCDTFKAYCFRSSFVRNQIISKASYTTRALTNGRILSAVLLPVPMQGEQTAIAEVLTDMDAELAALEQRREKTRALKQAMMQELLTGRTRLV